MPNQHTGPAPIAPRFWSKVNKSRDCWLWTAGIGTDGYGKFWIDGRTIHASRMAYILTFGTIPDKLLVLHHCDNPTCVRPDHLYLGTQADNTADMFRRGRAPIGERHWTRLHPERIPRGDQHYSRLRLDRLPRGEEHGMSKLTTAAVLDIRKRYPEKANARELAKEYGVSPHTIWDVATRKTWRHI